MYICPIGKRLTVLGCFANSANNVTADFTVSEGHMTVTRCIAACNELGYDWAGIQARDRMSPRVSHHSLHVADRAECRCSKLDPRRNTAPVAAVNFCAIPCNGDSNQRCGGWGYVDLYNSPVTGTPSTPSNVTGDFGVPSLPGYQGVYTCSSLGHALNVQDVSMALSLYPSTIGGMPP